jgi:hypothetical protein
MTDVAVVTAKVAAIFPQNAEIIDFIAAEAITKGQAVYQTSAGKAGICDADVAGKGQFRGIALNSSNAGGAVSVLKRGHIAGFTISQAYDAPFYVSIVAGAIADAAGVIPTPVGRVVAMPDKALTKVLYVDADWVRTWAS